MGLKETWGLREEDFLVKSREGHPRERERWLCLLWLFQGASQSEVSRRLKRTRETIQIWKENFEEKGPSALKYQKTGGWKFPLTKKEEKELANIIGRKHPEEVGVNGNRWTMKVVLEFVKERYGKELKKAMYRSFLKRNRLKLKRPKKFFKSKNNRASGICGKDGRERKEAKQKQHNGVCG